MLEFQALSPYFSFSGAPFAKKGMPRCASWRIRIFFLAGDSFALVFFKGDRALLIQER
jgi:hypothetical protein